MSTTDNNKYKNWVFTFNLGTTLPPEEVLDAIQLGIKKISSSYIFQIEKGEETHKYHYQGCLQTPYRIRHRTLLSDAKLAIYESLIRDDENSTPRQILKELLPGLTLDRMQGTWEQAQAYCTKKETSVRPPMSSPDLESYRGDDINFLESATERYIWQQQLFEEIFTQNQVAIKDADSRTIYWITDEHGCTGKSKFVKYCCYNNPNCAKVSFGSSTQLRSSLIALGQKKVYFIDIPRTMGKEDHLEDLITVLEDLKNGFLVSCMYGKYQSLMMEPPHVIVFSNQYPPFNTMSKDRWKAFSIDRVTKMLIEEQHGRIHY